MASKLRSALTKARGGLSHGRKRARKLLGPKAYRGIGAGVVGGVAQMAGQMGREHVGFLKDKWYGEPAALALVGVLAMKKSQSMGTALCGAAGYAAALYYRLSQFQAGKSQTSPVPAFTQTTQGGGSTAELDAGFLQA